LRQHWDARDILLTAGPLIQGKGHFLVEKADGVFQGSPDPPVELQGPLLALLACSDGLAMPGARGNWLGGDTPTLVTSHPLVSGSTWWDDTAR
jgi:hypothetical protein